MLQLAQLLLEVQVTIQG